MDEQTEAQKGETLPRSCSLEVAEPRPEPRFVCPRAGVPPPPGLLHLCPGLGTQFSLTLTLTLTLSTSPTQLHGLREEMYWEREEAKHFRNGDWMETQRPKLLVSGEVVVQHH